MKTKLLAVIYLLVGVLYILSRYNLSLRPAFVLKALIMPLLMSVFLVNLRPSGNRFHILLLVGLLFSWAGDLFLQVPPEVADMFIPGLSGFLLAHIMYLYIFFATPGKNIITRRSFYLVIPIILYGSGLIWYLYNDLGSMKIPVILYAAVILTMLTGAVNRLEKVNPLSYYIVLSGAILFVISDSALAVNKFSHPFEASELVVMSTYVTAQLLIVTGYIKQYIKTFK